MFISGSTWEQRAARAAQPHEALTGQARALLASLDPFALEAIAEAAIGLLDDLRDPDEDRCEAGDDGCGIVAVGNGAGLSWGAQWDEVPETTFSVEYGIDQRAVPMSTFVVD